MEVDEALLRRLHAKAVAAAAREAQAEGEGGGGGGGGLAADDITAYKRRIAELLLPGETVLAALRRLGGWRPAGALWRAGRRFGTAAMLVLCMRSARSTTWVGRPDKAHGAVFGEASALASLD